MTPKDITPSDYAKRFQKEFKNLYDYLKGYVLEHQGRKGFINTSDLDCDHIYVYVYNEMSGQYDEQKVLGIQVYEDQLCVFSDYEGASFNLTATDEELSDNDSENWQVVCGGMLKGYDALYSIAEFIEQYT